MYSVRKKSCKVNNPLLFPYKGIRFAELLYLICILIFLCAAKDSYATGWSYIKSLNVSEVFSDNINLSQKGQETSAFVTEISPGISIRRLVGRNRLNLNYRLQGLYNSGGNQQFDINHQLQLNSNTAIYRNSLFLGLNGSISQQNISNRGAANDNISGSQNRTNVYTFGVSPRWTPRFNGYANADVQLNYNLVNTDRGLASNSQIIEARVGLNSSWRFSRFRWSADYQRREEIRDEGNNVSSHNANGTARFFLERRVSAFATVGYAENNFNATTTNNRNGVFYTLGMRYRPNYHFSVEAGYGNNMFVTVELWPFRRLRLTTTYQYNNIGTNTGSVWNASLRYSTGRSRWEGRYFEDTTTTQTVLSEIQSFTVLDAFGEVILDPVTSQPVQFDVSLPTLTNEVFIRRRGELGYTYRTGKSNIGANIFGEKREFQVRQNDEEVFGINASWLWSFTRNSSLALRPAWQLINRKGLTSSTDNRFDILVDLTRRIPLKLGRTNVVNASLQYRFLKQISDTNVIDQEDNRTFEENRITATLRVIF